MFVTIPDVRRRAMADADVSPTGSDALAGLETKERDGTTYYSLLGRGEVDVPNSAKQSLVAALSQALGKSGGNIPFEGGVVLIGGLDGPAGGLRVTICVEGDQFALHGPEEVKAMITSRLGGTLPDNGPVTITPPQDEQ